MIIDINTGEILEEDTTVFWKGMKEKDFLISNFYKGENLDRIKRNSACLLDRGVDFLGLCSIVTVIFKDEILRQIIFRWKNDDEKISLIYGKFGKYSILMERQYLLDLISKIEMMEININFLPEIGYRHSWGDIKVVTDLKNDDCYLLVKY